MLEFDDDFHHEEAPDLSLIKEENDIKESTFVSEPIRVISDAELSTVFKESLPSFGNKVSARRSLHKDIKPSAVKKMKKPIDPEFKLTTVETENSISTTTDVASYYKDLQVIDEETNETEKPDYTDAEKEKLKSIIKLFLITDDKCSEIRAQVTELNNEKKQYEEHILEFMSRKNKDTINEGSTKLNKKVTQRKLKPKENDVFESLKQVFNDEDVAWEVTQRIYDSMGTEEVVKLERDDDDGKPKKTKKTALK